MPTFDDALPPAARPYHPIVRRWSLLLWAIFGASCANTAPNDEPHGPSLLPAFTLFDGEPGAARPVASAPQDSAMLAAGRALAEGKPWEASRLLAPLLRDPSRRTPAVVLRAAEAATLWEGWPQVVDLLGREPWLDTEFGGRGNVLAASALLAMSPRRPDTDSAALSHARRAMRTAGAGVPANADVGMRHVLLARALDRLNALDSARLHYERAGALIPELADWLSLRAASGTSDGGARARYYRTLRTDVARDRQGVVEAAAVAQSGDLARAARLYAQAGDTVSALRLRFTDASHAADSAARSDARADLLALLTRTSGANARAAIDLFDQHTPKPTAAQQLAIARTAARIGMLPRAVAGFTAAFAAGLGDARDHFTCGELLIRLDRPREALKQFDAIPADAPLAGMAQYQGARALLRAGDGVAARKRLASTRAQYASDTAAASTALYLLGDLASDAAHDEDTRRYFLELARVYPRSALAPQARLRAALIAYAGGQYLQSARELDALSGVDPSARERASGVASNSALDTASDTASAPPAPHAEVSAASYWAARAYSAAGRTADARQRFAATVSRRPESYYAMLAAQALRQPVWAPSSRDTVIPGFADIDAAVARLQLLARLGMNDEMGFEQDWLASHARTSTGRMLATAKAFAARGLASRAIALARAALDSGAAPSVAVYRLLYPITQRELLQRESERHALDPALVAALIRQESSFNPRAVSAVGARGLMQVMPSVGKAIAASLDFGAWDPALLFQPDVNVQIGVRHLASSLARRTHPAYALAAYNAGESRERRWHAKRGADDPALFVELIPFVETRDYVRIVLRNREFYRALYAP